MLQNVIYVVEYFNKNTKASFWKVTLPAAASSIVTNALADEEFVRGNICTLPILPMEFLIQEIFLPHNYPTPMDAFLHLLTLRVLQQMPQEI
ncbi:MAG: hypothetical protein ABIO46_06725 [Chitinophagales bacterium]